MILTLIVLLTIVMAPRLTLWQVHNAASGRGYQALIDAKAAILAHAASPDADVVPPMPAGRRLGQISFTPDLPVAPGTTFTGLAGLTAGGRPGCATNTWVPGQALVDPDTNNPPPHGTPLTVRCFGRFPWLSYGLEGPSTADDEGGTVPWMFISANLVVGFQCLLNLNPLMLSSGFTAPGGCGTPVPFPWLKVVDERGNLLSSEVAIVLILPGPPVNNVQQRTAPNDHSPAAYLEGLTVAAGCPAPCVPGTYNNAAYTVANGLAWTFVSAPPSTALGPPPAYYQQPFTFNDRMIYITASEYLEAMEVRAREYLISTLNTYKSVNRYLPYSGEGLAPLTRNCTGLNKQFGLLPALTCPGAAPWLLPSFTNAGWGNYFIYAVAPGCVFSTKTTAPAPPCPGASLRLGAAATLYNAVLFSPGRAIQTAPFAVTRGMAQQPLTNGWLADFLDSVPNTGGGPVFDAAGTLPTANYDDRMYGIL
jgi:hypothetical protein